MTLQTKDLMIGDWVRVPDLDKYVRVNAVYPTMICPNPHDDDVHPVIGDEYLQPIPLTPEILEKNGWEHCYDMWYSDEGVQLMTGYDGKNRLWWYISANPVVPINFVHELQHILRIKRIEKEIEL